jgi:hypothetical protein
VHIASHQDGERALQATIVVRSRRFWPMLLRGGLGFGEAYVEGH